MNRKDAMDFRAPEKPPEPQRPSWRRRMLKKLLCAGAILLIVIVAAGIGAPLAAKTQWGRNQIERRLSRTFRAPVEVGSAEWSWRSGLRLRNLTIGPVFSGETAVELEIEYARFRPKLRKLLSRKVRGELTLAQVHLRIRPNDEGETLPELRWPRDIGRELKIERLHVYGGTVSIELPHAEELIILKGVNVEAGLTVRGDRAYLSVPRFSASLNDGTVSGKGLISMDHGVHGGAIATLGADIRATPALAHGLRHIDPVFEIGPDGSIEGLVDFEISTGGAGVTTGWLGLREGSGSVPNSMDVSFTLGEQ